MRKVWSGGACTLPKGFFRLYQWKPSCNPYDLKIRSHSQVWVKMYGLGMEFWNPRILMGIARGIGLLIQIDKAMREKAFGYYAGLLAEVDLSSSIPNSVMVELPNEDGFSVDIVYKNLQPQVQYMCHDRVDCRNNKDRREVKEANLFLENHSINLLGRELMKRIRPLQTRKIMFKSTILRSATVHNISPKEENPAIASPEDSTEPLDHASGDGINSEFSAL
ncbi:hypothetical protein Q3G72_025183 [Acer saccharum]|nr:hypothetical protein Q3G72_025183 [Acer saccharum]